MKTQSCLMTLTVLSASLWACSPEEVNTLPEGSAVVTPASVEDLDLDLSQLILPAELGSSDLSIAQSLTLGTAAGGPNGFFLLGAGGFEQIDPSPINGIVNLEGTGFLIGRADGLRIWDGALKGTTLDDAIAEAPVMALATRGSEVWIATEDDLFLFDGQELLSFSIKGVEAIETFAGSRDVLLGGDTMSILRKEAGEWTLAEMIDEPVDGALPASGDRILGLSGGALMERIDAGEDQVVWRKVSLSSEENDQGASDVESITTDPGNGDLWIATSTKIVKLTGADVSIAQKPEGMGEVIRALVSSDGVAWFSDGESLWSAGDDENVITFTTHIEPFSDNNCSRCHPAENGIGHPIASFEQWTAEAEEILNQLETGAMPADGSALVGGSADLVRRWIEGGLQE